MASTRTETRGDRKEAAVKSGKRARRKYARKAKKLERKLEKVARKLPVDTPVDEHRRHRTKKRSVFAFLALGGAAAAAFFARRRPGGAADSPAPDAFGTATRKDFPQAL